METNPAIIFDDTCIVFGKESAKALELADLGKHRTDIQKDTGAILGVHNASLTVNEGEILAGSGNPDLLYNQIIRPWKSRLGLFYIEHRSFLLDLQLCWLTVLCIFARPRALRLVARQLDKLGADEALVRVALRQQALSPTAPPGASDVVRQR